ncbi:ABC transporter permease [Maioricimonas sp. JC845]|uniref:ABC transporter permease n=1 Tax=Maioricimonas sp. JC845 TaxID=3232138 RepID=UPI00345826EC
MRKVVNLAIGFLREHPVRFVLTTVATAAATCLVLWVASSYEALLTTYDEYANLALGRYELAIAPISMKAEDHVPPECLEDLRKAPSIVAADPMWAQRVDIRTHGSLPVESRRSDADSRYELPRREDASQSKFAGGPGSGPDALMPDALFLATDAPAPPFDLDEGRWLTADGEASREAVVRADVARRRGLAVGDEIIVEREGANDDDEDDDVSLRVVGILGAPSLAGQQAAGIPILAPSSGEFFIATALAEELFGASAEISLIGVSVAPDVDITKFRFGWAPQLNQYSTPVQFQEAYEIEEALDQAAAAQNVRLQSYASTGVALVVSLLVIFCTLSMGVTERVRQYAVLRAIALTRSEIGLLIAIEGIVLAVVGLAGGVIAGWALLYASAAARPDLLYHGAPIGATSLWLAVVATLGGGLLASIVPAWRATRVRPIDAMAPRPDESGGDRVRWSLVLAGLALIAVNPLLAFVFPPNEQTLHIVMPAGYLCMSVGFVLMAPAVVAAVDRWCGPLLVRLVAVDPRLLSSQITMHVWRTAGTAIAMAVGMGLFIAIHVWGFTMLQAFIPGEWIPDAIVTLGPGLSPEDVEQIADLPGVDSERCLPMVAEQPRLLHDLTGSADRPSVTRQDNVIIVGLDPDRALGASHPLFQFEWVAGDLQSAIEQMRRGRACIVPDHFLDETGLRLGDTFSLVPPEDAENIVEYTIAGAVRMTGWHWQTKLTGLRPRTHRAAALVIASYGVVARDFDRDAATHIWFSYDSPQVDADTVASTVETTVQRLSDQQSEGDSAEEARVISAQGIREHIQGVARRWIWMISQVPIIALLIASLGVVNVLLASVRSRRWEFGVLRAVGVTRSELARAILAEGLLVAAVACLLSLGFGVIAGWCGCGMAQYVSFFGGLHPPLIIPWSAIGFGMTLVILLGVVSAVWPAYQISRAQPLALLQEGLGEF